MYQAIYVPDHAQQDYLSEQLGKVSRSFALVVPFVDAPTRHYLATAYLLCRVADNIEDCRLPDAWKQSRLIDFRRLLDTPGRAETALSAAEITRPSQRAGIPGYQQAAAHRPANQPMLLI